MKKIGINQVFKLALAALLSACSLAAADPEGCTSPGSCPAAISVTTYQNRLAYRLSDGRSEAVIVPELGRVMSFNLVGKPNLLWTSNRQKFKPDEWRNWGGAKTWPAPMAAWPQLIGRHWPPPTSWENQPQEAEVLSGGILRLTTAPLGQTGVKLAREFHFDANGDFVIRQIATKHSGEPVDLSLWSVTQIKSPDVVLLPKSGRADLPAGYHWLMAPTNPASITSLHDVLEVKPTRDSPSKLGVDNHAAWALALKYGTAFLQQASRPAGSYPDAVAGGGFPVELFFNGQQREPYTEIELLSPVRTYHYGSRWQHTVRWHLYELPSSDIPEPATRAALDKIIAPLQIVSDRTSD